MSESTVQVESTNRDLNLEFDFELRPTPPIPSGCEWPPAGFRELGKVPDRPTLAGPGSVSREYFHGDSGTGVGASHQTGWTGMVTKLIQQSGESRERVRKKITEPAAAEVTAV